MRLSLLSLVLAFGLANAQASSSGGANRHLSIIAHGTLMSLAFLIFFPFGALTVRVLSFKHTVWLHAVIQLLALALVIAGVGLGIWIAITPPRHSQLDLTHPIIGLVVFALLCFQPIGGLLHHLIMRKSVERKQTFIGEWHKWFGRALVLLGAINGGLGLQLSGNTTGGEIAYGVVAGVVFIVYVVVDVVAIRKDKRTREREIEEKKNVSSKTAIGSIDAKATSV